MTDLTVKLNLNRNLNEVIEWAKRSSPQEVIELVSHFFDRNEMKFVLINSIVCMTLLMPVRQKVMFCVPWFFKRCSFTTVHGKNTIVYQDKRSIYGRI